MNSFRYLHTYCFFVRCRHVHRQLVVWVEAIFAIQLPVHALFFYNHHLKEVTGYIVVVDAWLVALSGVLEAKIWRQINDDAPCHIVAVLWEL